MKAQQYREMGVDELANRLEELQRNVFDMKTQAVTEKLENTKGLRNTRRDIARIKTILREKTITAKQGQ
jgi:large subunit ribosomal protein L29